MIWFHAADNGDDDYNYNYIDDMLYDVVVICFVVIQNSCLLNTNNWTTSGQVKSSKPLADSITA